MNTSVIQKLVTYSLLFEGEKKYSIAKKGGSVFKRLILITKLKVKVKNLREKMEFSKV